MPLVSKTCRADSNTENLKHRHPHPLQVCGGERVSRVWTSLCGFYFIFCTFLSFCVCANKCSTMNASWCGQTRRCTNSFTFSLSVCVSDDTCLPLLQHVLIDCIVLRKLWIGTSYSSYLLSCPVLCLSGAMVVGGLPHLTCVGGK